MPLFFILIALVSLPAVAEESLGVGLMDAPVDYSHPEIAPYIDADLLKSLPVTDEAAKLSNAFDVNSAYSSEAKAAVAKVIQTEPLLYDAFVMNNLAIDKSCLTHATDEEKKDAEALRAAVKSGHLPGYLINPAQMRESMGILAMGLHGSHTSGLLTKGLAKAHLVNLPIAAVAVQKKFSQLRRVSREQIRSYIAAEFARADAALKKGRVRVFNLSIGLDYDMIRHNMEGTATFFQRLLSTRAMESLSDIISAGFTEGMRSLFRKNPETLFVVAAGNDHKEIGRETNSMALIQEPNVVTVAALNLEGEAASFTNYSSKYVEIAAPGTCIESAHAGGGEMKMNGTSMASPIVANRLALIFEKNPQLTADAALAKLYSDETTLNAALDRVSVQGRALR